MTRATAFSAALPDWLRHRALPDRVVSDGDRMALVHELADTNWRAGNGGPFAAIVVDSATGDLVSAGVNVVLSSGLSSTHAEVVALSLAQATLGSWDLGAGRDLELVVNWRPCAMCYGATIWSGVRRLVIAGSGPECEQLTGFDEGPIHPDWAAELVRRGVRVMDGVLREEACEMFRAFAKSGRPVYNARKG